MRSVGVATEGDAKEDAADEDVDQARLSSATKAKSHGLS